MEARQLLAVDLLAQVGGPPSTLSSRPENLVHVGPYTVLDALVDVDCEGECASPLRRVFSIDRRGGDPRPLLEGAARLDDYVLVGESLVFRAGNKLYSTQGGPQDTELLMEFPESPRGARLVPMRNRLLILSDSNTDLRWTDGRSEPIQIELPFATSSQAFLGVLDGRAVFWDRGVLWSTAGPGDRRLHQVTTATFQAASVGTAFQETLWVEGRLNDVGVDAAGLFLIDPSSRTRTLVHQGNLSGVREMIAFDNLLYFSAYTPEHGRELYRIRATRDLELVLDARPGGASGDAQSLTEFDGKLYFSAAGTLWSYTPASRSTSASTDVVRQFSGHGSSGPHSLTLWNGQLTFVADDGQGEELWVSDGTAGGTRLVADLWPGPRGSSPTWLAPSAEGLFFTAQTREFGEELWVARPDGSVSLAFDLRQEPSPRKLQLAELTRLGDAVYFRLDDGVHGAELWRTRGTEKDTELVTDLYLGTRGSSPRNLQVLEDRLFFSANDGAHGYEMWTSDGTEGGTTLLADVWEGHEGSAPSRAFSMRGEVWFAANDGSPGEEIWQLVGSELQPVADVQPLGLATTIQTMVEVADRVYLAPNPEDGQGLWQLRTPDRALPVSDAFYDFDVMGDTLVWVGDALMMTDGGRSERVDRIREEQDRFNSLVRSPSHIYALGQRGIARLGAEGWTHFDGLAHAATALWANDRDLFFARTLGERVEMNVLRGGRSQVLAGAEGTLSLAVADAGGLAWAVRRASGGVELWYSDGSVAGTQLLELFESGQSVEEVMRFDGQLLVMATDAANAQTLWRVPLPGRGDFDGDGALTVADVDLLTAAMAMAAPDDRFDLSDDGLVDSADLQMLVEEELQKPLGDFDLDGRVDFRDFLTLAANFGTETTRYSSGNLNGDNEIDFADFLLFAQLFASGP